MKTNKITNGVKITVYIPREWHDVLKADAEKNGLMVSFLYRTAIKEYMERHYAVKV